MRVGAKSQLSQSHHKDRGIGRGPPIYFSIHPILWLQEFLKATDSANHSSLYVRSWHGACGSISLGNKEKGKVHCVLEFEVQEPGSEGTFLSSLGGGSWLEVDKERQQGLEEWRKVAPALGLESVRISESPWV